MKASQLKTNLGFSCDGPLLIIPKLFEDERGYFYESWNEDVFNKLINKRISFVQDNHSKSEMGVLRGLHYQLNPFPQSKLVRCTMGLIYDVAVDLRQSSKTFGQSIGILLSEKNKYQFWIPEGFAHGFLTLSEYAEIQYKTSSFWKRSHERSILWNDKDLNICWPLERLKDIEILMTEKDILAPSLKEANIKGELFK